MRCLLAVVLVLTATADVGRAQAFTAAHFKGSYAFRFDGLESGMRVVSSGVMTLDGIGAVTGSAGLRRAGGGECTFTIRSSTYSVKADGTGFFALGFFPDGICAGPSLAIHFNMAASSVDQFAFSSAVGTFAGHATRQDRGPFSTAAVAGTYTFQFAGLDGFTPTVASGFMTLDGKGSVTGRATFKKETTGSCIGAIRSSTYGVTADGTGFMALGFFPDGCGFGEALLLSIAVIGPKRGFEFASSGNSLYTGTAKLQVPPTP